LSFSVIHYSKTPPPLLLISLIKAAFSFPTSF
jgi:hypothetical protein